MRRSADRLGVRGAAARLAVRVGTLLACTLGVCSAQRSGFPSGPSTLTLTREDTAATARWPNSTGIVVQRRIYVILLKSTASGDSVRALFRSVHGEVIGVFADRFVYYIRVPDPGAEPAKVQEVVETLSRHAFVQQATPAFTGFAPAKAPDG